MTTRTTSSIRFAAAVATMMASVVGRAMEPSPPEDDASRVDLPMQFNIPRLPASQAADWFSRTTGIQVGVPRCPDVMVGPLSGNMTPAAAWSELVLPLCLGGDRVDGVTLGTTPLGESVFDFQIDRASRAQVLRKISRSAGLPIDYLPASASEEQDLVGPIRGRRKLSEAIDIVLSGSDLVYRWVAPDIMVIEPRHHADGCACPPSIEVVLPQSGEITVTDSRLSGLGEHLHGPVTVLDRKRIDEIGAANLPDLLRYISPTAFTRSAGYRASGAQYAEMRGLGAENTLVLINGRRAYASAADLLANAFDLSTIPLPAVERVEVSFDSTSLVQGADAIGGVINIVMKQSVNSPTAEVRYGSASGGAAERRGAISLGHLRDRSNSALVLDYFEGDILPGTARSRSRDQDFRRYGGTDQRSRFSAPANIRSVDGTNLPGLNSSFAAVDPNTELGLRPGEVNLTSLGSFISIVPATRRASLWGSGDVRIGSASLSGETLITRREASTLTVPSIIPGFELSGDHPQNPFDTPVIVEAALTGLGQREAHVESELLRGVTEIRGPVGRWTYSAFLLHSQERASTWHSNAADPVRVKSAMRTSNIDDALNVLSAEPGAGLIPAGIMASLAAPRIDRYHVGATQLTAMMNGPAIELPAGDVSAHVGLERRRETARFDDRVGEIVRSASSGFAELKIPLVHSSMRVPAVADLELSLAARRDDYSDMAALTSAQYGVSWKPVPPLKVHATAGQSHRRASPYENYSAVFVVPTQIFDPQRRELVSIEGRTGGNPNLAPSTGASGSVGITYESKEGWQASLNYWQIELRDRISLLPPVILLAHEAEAISGRIVRDAATAADLAAGLPGRLVSLDVTRANFGGTETRGIDVSIKGYFATRIGSFEPRLDFTNTLNFKYSDLPTIDDAPQRERVDVASVFGSVLRERAVASLTYEGHGWRGTIFGRYSGAYSDYLETAARTTGRKIPSRTLWDINVAKTLGSHISVTLGVSDLLDKAPPFAEVTGGFDRSQGDLTGRKIYLTATGSF